MAMTSAPESIKVTAGVVRRFKIGDLVVLKSGGPAMTIWAIGNNFSEMVAIYRTNWFVGGELHRDDFSDLEIESVPSPELKKLREDIEAMRKERGL